MPGSLSKFSPEKYPALTGIRAVAAYLVFFHHYASLPQVGGGWAGIFGQGHVGVTLFYVLSGFLITYNYSPKADLTRGFWLQYLSRRVGKIYPLYIFLLALTYLLLARMKAPSPTALSVLLNFTLWKGFFDDFKFDGIGPSWSLTVEETFYVLAPFLFLATRKVGHIAVQALLYATGGFLLLVGTSIAWYGFFGSFRFVFLYTFFGRSLEFMLGMALAHALLRRPDLLATAAKLKLTYVGLGGSILVVLWMSLLRRGSESGISLPLGMVFNNVALPISVCILLCGLVSERTLLRRMLALPLVVFLGRSSYAFYLVHFGILAMIISSNITNLSPRLQVGVIFVSTNAVSAVLFLVVEHPANTLVRRWAHRLANWRLFTMRFADPGRRLRQAAVLWTSLFTSVFAIWCARSLDWRNFTAFMSSLTGETAQVEIDLPQFARPISARTEFGLVTSRIENLSHLALTVGGENISARHFIFAHANSRLEYELPNGKWTRFEFSTGLDDVGDVDLGSVVYVVRGDGKVLFSSPVVRSMECPVPHSVNVRGVRRLELLTTDAQNGVTSDEAYWIEPILR